MFINQIIGSIWGVVAGTSAAIIPGVSSQSSSSIAQLAGVIGNDAQSAALVTSLISSQVLGSIKEVCSPEASGSVVGLNKNGLFRGLNKRHLIKGLIKAKVVSLISGLAIGFACGSILLSLKSSVGLSAFAVIASLIKSKENWLKILLFFGSVQGWFVISSLFGIVAPVPALASAVFFMPNLIKGILNKEEREKERNHLNKKVSVKDESKGAKPVVMVNPIDLVAGLAAFATPGISKEGESESDSLNKVVTLSCMECFMEGVSLPLMMMGGTGSKTSSQILLSNVGVSELLLVASAVLLSLPLINKVQEVYESIGSDLIKVIGILVNSAVVFSSCGLWAVLLILLGLALNKMELPTEVMSMMYFGAVL